ncbi:DUF4917 family protein [Pseudomonas sp. 3JA]|uniref:DUF4917 family protein n=1 Tax=Pseudomonas sp. 3JA TaxID=3109347 RepID=UPI00300A9136
MTFEEAFSSIGDDSRSILLANGFSQAWNKNIFSYKSLFSSAEFGEREQVIRRIFDNFKTYDFEKIMKKLIATEDVLKIYNADPGLIQKVQTDQEVIKNALIEVISKTHPELPHEVTDSQYVSVRKFLKPFDDVFTLNYDLLFYWARNKDRLEPDYETDDGFRAGRIWEGPPTQNVHFLHGGLHIYDTQAGVKKHAFNDQGESIIEQVKWNMENKRFPTFVSEPSHERKRVRIQHNPYLSYCFDRLGGLDGVLFIYGHSFDANDRHIFDQIRWSRVYRVFVSVYGDEDSEENTLMKGRAQAYLGAHKVEFFKAESARIWR